MSALLRFAVLVCISLLAAGLVPAVGVAEDEDVRCTVVVSELNRRITRGMNRGTVAIAKALQTEPARVEECLGLYGRRVKGPPVGAAPEPRKVDPFDADNPAGFQDPFPD